MYYSMQILLKYLLDTCYFLCRNMTEVTTWQNNDDNCIAQPNGCTYAQLPISQSPCDFLERPMSYNHSLHASLPFAIKLSLILYTT